MESNLAKIVVFVPEVYADMLRLEMGKAGAGHIGNYQNFSFSTKGIGRFEPMKGANPSIGVVGDMEAVQEERIEMICEKSKVGAVVKKIREVHPYEEPAIDIYPLLKV